jgi:methanogenic corrinoid protein MtbC1
LAKDVKIIIVGYPVTPEFAQMIGADAATANAAEGVKICQKWVN